MLVFSTATHTLTPHLALAEKSSIKCISPHATTGQIAFVQADRPNWWSARIQFLNPSGSLSLPGEQFYKAR